MRSIAGVQRGGRAPLALPAQGQVQGSALPLPAPGRVQGSALPLPA